MLQSSQIQGDFATDRPRTTATSHIFLFDRGLDNNNHFAHIPHRPDLKRLSSQTESEQYARVQGVDHIELVTRLVIVDASAIQPKNHNDPHIDDVDINAHHANHRNQPPTSTRPKLLRFDSREHQRVLLQL
jgi:hypothetical protein